MTVDIILPKAWSELSQPQLHRLFRTMASVQAAMYEDSFLSRENFSTAESAQVKAYCLFAWSDLEVVCRYGDGFLVSVGKSEGLLRHEDVAAAISALDWMDALPDKPVRLDRIAGRKCYYSADISNMNLETYLALDNLWTGYLITQSTDCVVQMIGMCYHRPRKPKPFEIISMVYWWAAVKDLLSKRYPDFFSGEPAESPDYDSIRRNIDTMLRALSKGDPTKEAQILSLKVDRALAELDAQAREAKELERISKS